MQADKGNILISGASGMIGSALGKALEAEGYRVWALSRHDSNAPFYYDQQNRQMHLSQEIPLQAVINLAGANISDGRWTEARKQEILHSRQHTTEDLCQALATLPQAPQVLLSASAMGYYGDTGVTVVDESSPAGDDFLAQISTKWEAATAVAEQAGIRTVHMRLGLVLSPEGGLLANFILPLSLAVVGRVGSGRQYMSWISLPDVLQIILQLLEDDSVSGPINLVSEQPVQNQEFSRCLAATLHRPCLPPLPAFMVRLMFGEMADGALLVSNRVQSLRLSELGITLQHPDLASALQAVLNKQP
jgi:uncharacterized protein (TIGR01777 family)